MANFYRSNLLNFTASDIGAVATTASQGLSDTEKTNARANIGAGTSNFSGSYNDLSNKPTIPTVNNATLTIQKNGTNVNTFTANASSNVTANITVPTKVSELTNDSGYTTNTGTVTSVKVGTTSYNPSSGVVSLPAYPTVNNATLTIQKNGTNVNTFTANASSNVTANITVPTKVSELTNDSGYTTNTGTVTSVKVGTTSYNPSSGVVSLPAYPTVPTVNNATLTIQKNATTVKTFTANASSDVTCNITVPTKVSELTNDSGYTTNTGTVTSVKVGTTSYNPSSGVVSLPAYPSVPVSSVAVNTTGTASDTAVSYQRVAVNGSTYYEINGTKYMEDNSKTTANDLDTFSFTNAAITDSGVYDIYANKFGVAPTSVTISGTTMTVQFKSSDAVTACRVYIK